MRYPLQVLILFLLVTSCASPRKMIDRGRYDEAISALVSKLAGKKKRDRDWVVLLETAFRKAQERDLNKEASIRKEDGEDKWERLLALYRGIEHRQDLVEGLLPLVATDGYQASFRFIHTGEIVKESRKKSAEHYYQTAQLLLRESESTSDKTAARKALDFLNKIDPLFSDFRDKEVLKRQAHRLGTDHYLLRISNKTEHILPFRVEEELHRFGLDELNSAWSSFDARPDPGVEYDYWIQLDFLQMEFSPERESSRVFDEVVEKEEEETETDANGKVLKDSLGKPVVHKVVRRYPATMEETTQSKSVLVTGRLSFIRARSEEIAWTKPVSVEGVFENRYGRLIKGDSRHLSDAAKKLTHAKALPFPSNEVLLLDAAERLKKRVKEMIRQQSQ